MWVVSSSMQTKARTVERGQHARMPSRVLRRAFAVKAEQRFGGASSLLSTAGGCSIRRKIATSANT